MTENNDFNNIENDSTNSRNEKRMNYNGGSEMTKTYGECKYFTAPFGFFCCTKYWTGREDDELEPCKMKNCEEIE